MPTSPEIKVSESQQAYFLAIILQLCRRYAGSITSWIRTPTRNAKVGGTPTSQHITGTAVDIVLDNPKDADNLIKTAKQLGLQAFNEQDHIHIEVPPKRKTQ